MINWIIKLFPICRSITGNGVRESLTFFEKINPELKRIKFKSGSKVFDWTIPLEWNIKDAYISLKGKKIVNFRNSNLHVMSYSSPIKKTVSLKELLLHTYTNIKRPNCIPYVTSYYKKNWGFCMKESMKKKLKKGHYKVFINSTLKKGFLECSHSVLKGKSKKEIFFNSYICHPSMANNELSGPALLNQVLLYVKKNYPQTNYSYRFFLGPETIGPIAYLSKFHKVMKKNIICGFNFSCVGDEKNYSIVHSPNENTLADRSLLSAIFKYKNSKTYSFIDGGSNEIQYCSPQIDLPLVTFCKTKFGVYPEYHTSDDNLKLVSEKGLAQSFEVIKNIIDSFEFGAIPKAIIKCEPNLGKRNLYPTISAAENYGDKNFLLRRHLIAFSNSKKTIFDIALKINCPLKDALNEYKLLVKKKVLGKKYI